MEFNSVKDSGKRQEFETGSKRDTRDGKGRYDLIPGYAIRKVAGNAFHKLSPIAVQRLARHYENGGKKYGDWNWTKGQPLSRYLDSAIRHMFKVVDGQLDEDHQAAAAWNMLGYIETKHRIDIGILPKELNDMQPSVERIRICPGCDGGCPDCRPVQCESASLPPLAAALHDAIAHAFMTLEGLTDMDHAVVSAKAMMQYIELYHQAHKDDGKVPAVPAPQVTTSQNFTLTSPIKAV